MAGAYAAWRNESMSYDLIFWRGITSDKPGDVLKKLSRGEAVEGLELLDRERIVAVFGEVFEGKIRIVPAYDEYGDCLEGPMYGVRLREPLRSLWVTCAWGIVKQPDLHRRLIIAGYDRLGCHLYNPQIEKFFPAKHQDA
jgi:hypothetical protein